MTLTSTIKLIAIDLDGTLLTNDKRIPADNIKAIDEAMLQGIQIVICTGRTLPSVRHLLAQLPVHGDDGYLILQNGTVTHQLPDFQVVSETTLQLPARQALSDFMLPYDLQGGCLISFDRDNMWVSSNQEFNQWVMDDAAILQTEPRFLSHEDFRITDTLHKAMAIAAPALIDQIEQSVTDLVRSYVAPVRSQDYILEFLPQGHNKASALKALAAHLDLEADHVMAIGDQLNDLEMIEWAGIGVAMGNAVAPIVAAASFQTDTNENAGVAKAIQRILR